MPTDTADSNATSPTVTVRGDAIVRSEPDEAMLWISLSALKDAPASIHATFALELDYQHRTRASPHEPIRMPRGNDVRLTGSPA